MAKPKDQPKSLADTKKPFWDSLERYTGAANQLAIAVRSLLDAEAIQGPPRLTEILRERLAEFDRAWVGE
jgi:hypothetical protein